nr:MAG TPA: hypothetical protein [Caudoviricetes sp.]
MKPIGLKRRKNARRRSAKLNACSMVKWSTRRLQRRW